jgi:hypothetical protein
MRDVGLFLLAILKAAALTGLGFAALALLGAALLKKDDDD